MAYATAQDLKDYLGISGTGDDTLLGTLIGRAQAMLEAPPPLGAGRLFESASHTTRKFHAIEDVDGQDLILDYDLAAIVKVTNGDGVEVGNTEYVTIPTNESPIEVIRLRWSANKTWTYPNTGPEEAISVEGHWAYSETPPLAIVHATLRLAAFLYRQKENSQDFDRPVIGPDGSIILPIRLPADVELIVAPYRKVVVR